MDFGTLIGLVVGLFMVGAIGMQGEVMTFIDAPSLAIVIGGSAAATLMSNPIEEASRFHKVFMKALFHKPESPVALIKRMVEFAEIARRDGILALENVTETIKDPFLVKGIQLAVDGTDPELIEQILSTEMENIEARHNKGKRVIDTFRNMGPSWGALGTVIGLIMMLRAGIEDPNKLTSGMAVALITTFYGSMIASLFVGPIVDKLAARNTEEMHLKEIILRGVMSIQSGDNPRIVEQKLKIYLPPSQRDFGKEEE